MVTWLGALCSRGAELSGVTISASSIDQRRWAQAYEYNEWLHQQEAQPRLTRNLIHRDREVDEERLMVNYFDEYCKYPLYYFRRRYCMSRKLFLDIVEGIKSYIVDPLPKHSKFLTIQPDATGRMSLSVIIKCTSAIRQLAYSNTSDAFDKYLQMGEHTTRDCLDNFNKCIIDLCMLKYLRKPTFAGIENVYAAHENIHGFLRMLVSIDCMGMKKLSKIIAGAILEVVVSHDLWVWHAFFGVAVRITILMF
ncbi:ALP1-like protein [Tanacetum coccineum]